MISENLAKTLTERFGTRWIQEYTKNEETLVSYYVHGYIPADSVDGGFVVMYSPSNRYEGVGEFALYPYLDGELGEFPVVWLSGDLADGYKIYERFGVTSPRAEVMLLSYEDLLYGNRLEQLVVKDHQYFVPFDEIIPWEGGEAAITYCGGCLDPECCDSSIYRLGKVKKQRGSRTRS